MVNLLRVALALAAALVLVKPGQALTCGQAVTGVVTLTADLNCQNTSGLIVQTSNVTINLNGHTIRCLSATGYMGSCQAPNVGQAIGNAGILVMPQGWTPPGGPVIYKINIVGPGEIDGFEYGISVTGVFEVTINLVTITGPVDDNPPSDVNQGRSFAAGIWANASQCNVDLPGENSVTVEKSDISNQSVGIWMGAVSCGLIKSNYIHDNTGSHKELFVYGIELVGQTTAWPATTKNVISDNRVYRNGNNVYEFNWPGSWQYQWPEFDAGIAIGSQTATENQILNNEVIGNCGDGIQFNDASKNTVSGNTSLDNSALTYGGRCFAVKPGTMFDAAERWPGIVNNWVPINHCLTKSPGTPANACQ